MKSRDRCDIRRAPLRSLQSNVAVLIAKINAAERAAAHLVSTRKFMGSAVTLTCDFQVVHNCRRGTLS